MIMIMVHSELIMIRRLIGGRVFSIRQHVRFCPPFLPCQHEYRRSFSIKAPSVRPLISSCEYQELRNQIQTIGYGITSTPILSPSTVQAIRDRFKPLFHGEFETNIYPDEWHWRNGISLPTGVTREICNAYKSDLTIAQIILSPIMAKMVCNVMNWSSVRIAQDDVLWKPPAVSAAADSATSSSSSSSTLLKNATNRTVVGFHQDSAYISTQFEPYENNSVTVWIALDDATKETGCLEYAPGSHLWQQQQQQQQQQRPNNTRGVGEDEDDEDASSVAAISREETTSREKNSDVQTEGQKDDDTSTFHSCNADTYCASLPRRYTNNNENTHNDNVSKIVAAECMTGHAIFHHQDIWHGSGPNQSLTRHRRSLVGHYIRGDVQWKTHDSADEVTPWGSTSYIYGRYRTFGAIDLDESFFPILHAEPESGLKRTAWVDRYIGTNRL